MDTETKKKWLAYLTVHSMYWLMSDITYRFSGVSELDKYKGEDGTKGAKKHIRIKRILSYLYPDHLKENVVKEVIKKSKNGKLGAYMSNQGNPFVCNHVYCNVFTRELVKCLDNFDTWDGFYNFREKVRKEIISWGLSEAQLANLVDNVIVKRFFSSKLVYNVSKSEGQGGYQNNSVSYSGDLTYCMSGILELINYNDKSKCIELGELNEHYISYRNFLLDEELDGLLKDNDIGNDILEGIPDQPSEPAAFLQPHYLLRNVLNQLVFNKRCIVYDGNEIFLCNEDIKKEEFNQENKGVRKLAEKFKELTENKIEALTSTILFSIFLPVIVFANEEENNEESIKVDKNKVSQLIYKIFYEYNIKVNNREIENDKEMEAVKLKSNKATIMTDTIIEDIVDTYTFGVFDITRSRIDTLINRKKEFFESNEDLCFLNGILCEMGEEFINHLGLEKEKLLRNVYDYCKLNDYEIVKSSRWSEYYANTLLKYARYIFENKLEDSYLLEDIFERAENIGCSTVEYNKIYADILRTGVFGVDGLKKNLGEAYRLYVNVFSVTKQESLVDECIIPCLHEWSQNNFGKEMLMEKTPEEWEKLWLDVMLERGDSESIQDKFKEKCRENLDDRIKKIKEVYKIQNIKIEDRLLNDNDIQKVSISKDIQEVYIVFGAGKASRTFINLVRDKEKCEVLLVPQEHEIGLIQSLLEWYKNSNVRVITTGVLGALKSLELYQLMYDCDEDKNVFEKYYKNGVKRLHFMAIDRENREGNLASIVEVINQTWIRYYLYNMMAYSCTGVSFDFSEVDITINSQAQTAWYLDSVLNRFDEDFFVKINHISVADLSVRELLTEYPLFLADVNDLKKTGELSKTGSHDVVILGANRIIVPTLIKSILQVSGYMRDDKITADTEALKKAAQHEYKTFEDSIGNDFSLTLIDREAGEIKEAIAYEAPDMLESKEYVHVVPEFCEVNIQKRSFMKLFARPKLYENQEVKEEEIQLEKAYKAIKKANYIIVATEDTEESISFAMKIRTMLYRSDINNEPIISVYAPDSNLDEKINQFTIGKDIYEDAWHRSYRINMFGKYEQIYSPKNLFGSFFDFISRELHLEDDFKKRKKKIRDYYKVVYNHRSCDCRAIAFIYGMYSVLGSQMIKDFTLSDNPQEFSYSNRWSMEIFRDSLQQYLSKYNSIVGYGEEACQTGWIDVLAVLEHNRWNYMMMSEGYTGLPFDDFSDSEMRNMIISWAKRATDSESDIDNKKILKTACKDNKLHIAKVHFAIRTFESLGDRVSLSDLTKQDKEQLLKNVGQKEYDEIFTNHNQKTVGIDKFERVMDQIGKDIVGFKMTKNRQYDRDYALNMARTMERLLEFAKVSQENIKARKLNEISVKQPDNRTGGVNKFGREYL